MCDQFINLYRPELPVNRSSQHSKGVTSKKNLPTAAFDDVYMYSLRRPR